MYVEQKMIQPDFCRLLHPYELVKAFGDTMHGISEIHSKGCLHCDVKLGNFLYQINGCKVSETTTSNFCGIVL